MDIILLFTSAILCISGTFAVQLNAQISNGNFSFESYPDVATFEGDTGTPQPFRLTTTPLYYSHVFTSLTSPVTGNISRISYLPATENDFKLQIWRKDDSGDLNIKDILTISPSAAGSSPIRISDVDIQIDEGDIIGVWVEESYPIATTRSDYNQDIVPDHLIHYDSWTSQIEPQSSEASTAVRNVAATTGYSYMPAIQLEVVYEQDEQENITTTFTPVTDIPTSPGQINVTEVINITTTTLPIDETTTSTTSPAVTTTTQLESSSMATTTQPDTSTSTTTLSETGTSATTSQSETTTSVDNSTTPAESTTRTTTTQHLPTSSDRNSAVNESSTQRGQPQSGELKIEGNMLYIIAVTPAAVMVIIVIMLISIYCVMKKQKRKQKRSAELKTAYASSYIYSGSNMDNEMEYEEYKQGYPLSNTSYNAELITNSTPRTTLPMMSTNSQQSSDYTNQAYSDYDASEHPTLVVHDKSGMGYNAYGS